jgi:hypothetical protein
MKKLLSALAATILATAFALPLNAAPMFVQKPEQVRADIVEKVKQWKKGHGNRHWRGDRRWDRRQAWRSCRYNGNCYPRRYYGYRNYYPRYYRPYDPGYYRPYYPGYYPRSGVSIYLNF